MYKELFSENEGNHEEYVTARRLLDLTLDLNAAHIKTHNLQFDSNPFTRVFRSRFETFIRTRKPLLRLSLEFKRLRLVYEEIHW
jgi:hypothetical protein